MNICLVLNSKYIPQSIVFLNSLFLNNQEEDFIIYVIHSGLEEQYLKQLRDFIEVKFKYKFTPLKVEKDLFCDAPILWETHSKEAYYKILIPKIFPKDIKRVLYFDIDIIINGSIRELYNLDLKGNSLAATGDYFINKKDIEYKKQLGMNEKDIYFNSGVVLFDLESLRKDYDLEKMLQYIKEFGHQFHYHDQEVLNAFYYKKNFVFSEKFNCITKYKGIGDFFKYLKELKNKDNQPIVIHYAGIKPWNHLYNAKYLKLFWKYEQNTESGLEYKQYRKKRNKLIILVLLKKIYRIIIP